MHRLLVNSMDTRGDYGGVTILSDTRVLSSCGHSRVQYSFSGVSLNYLKVNGFVSSNGGIPARCDFSLYPLRYILPVADLSHDQLALTHFVMPWQLAYTTFFRQV